MSVREIETEGFEEALGRWLVDRGKLEAAGLERARRLRAGRSERLHVILMKLGLAAERDLAEALAELLDLPLLTPADYPQMPVLDGRLSPKFLKQSRLIPLADTAEGLVLAMADPLDDFAIQAVELLTGKATLPRIAVPADLEAAYERLYGSGKTTIGELIEDLDEAHGADAEEDAERLKDMAGEAPVIRLVNLLIGNAVESNASDIHIEPFETRLRVRYRIDGVLREIEAPPRRLAAATVSRVKIMAKLNIAERRLPQDGRIKLATRGKQIDLRVSTVPTMYGESVVMRVLDRGSAVLDFTALGFAADTAQAYLELLAKPNGIILVTGPTGSGKTTTLYASLQELNSPDRKVLAVEDPVEYQIEGVNQIQVKPQIGLAFANVLRSILRQDPDVIMIGEIRDFETAQIAVQAALTGHLVLSTLHTNSAPATVTRLLDMGLEDYLLTSTVTGIIAQRLVRKLCPDCRAPYEVLPELVEQARLDRFTTQSQITLYRAKGCEACRDTGYRGRTCVAELLVMSDPIRQLVLQQAEAFEIRRTAIENGMRTIFEDGMAKALDGVTSLEEVLRVVGES